MTDSPAARKAQLGAQYTQLAPEYDADGGFAHFGRRLVEIVGVEPGQRVLDVASGRGAVLFPAAERAGPAGHVEGIDLAEGMVRATNQDAERRGIRARVRLMDAEHLDFPDAAFDRVLCGFGIMFWPDQLQGLREIHRVLRPGGRFGLSTWREHQAHDLLLTIQALRSESPHRSTSLDEPEVLARLLTEAGFSDVQVAMDTHRVHHPDLDAYWRRARGSGTRRMVDALDADQTVRARVALAERLEPYRQADGYRVPATALIGTASR